jgi:hypothetical protein
MHDSTSIRRTTKQLIEDLALKSDGKCPHLREDAKSHYCGHGLNGQGVSDKRRLTCDYVSLRMWCLTKEDYKECEHYIKEIIV